MKKPPLPRSGGSHLREKDGSLRRLSPKDEEALQGRRETFAEAVDSLHSDPMLSATATIDRIKEALRVESDAELAWLFGTSPQSLSNRRARNSVPYREAVFVSLWAKVSLDYLLTGNERPK